MLHKTIFLKIISQLQNCQVIIDSLIYIDPSVTLFYFLLFTTIYFNGWENFMKNNYASRLFELTKF